MGRLDEESASPGDKSAPLNYGDNNVFSSDRGELSDDRFRHTRRGLKSRHAQMIALGGTIGTGLFVGSGQTLALGGPAFILGCYILVSFLVYCIVTAIAEVAAYLPTKGCSMNLFGHRYVSSSVGFALGWLYVWSLGILVPYEITAATLTIEYWKPDVPKAVWITIMLVIVIGLNLLAVSVYGETEFWFAGIKIIMIMGLLLLSVILFWGGGPSHDRLGFRYWKKPGAANTYLGNGDRGRFLALLKTLVLSSFPFAFAPEMLVGTGGEMKSPRINFPIASGRYFYRLMIFYVGSVLAIGVICPSNDPRLTSGGTGAGASPFVIGIRDAGIQALDSVINAGIIISAWSSANSFLYLSSRSLYGLALSGSAPSLFKTCSARGVPYWAVSASSLFAALAYLNLGSSSAEVFNWMVNIVNTSAFISWICCAIIYIRFRKAIRAQGVTELPYHSNLQPWGAWLALVAFTFLTLINGFDVFWPQRWSASRFLTAYIGLPVFVTIFVAHRIYAWRDPWARDPREVDLVTGLREVLEDEEAAPPTVYKHWWQYWRVIFE